MPKAGDKMEAKNISGRVLEYIWVVCPDCSEGRWVDTFRAKTMRFTGRCKECHIKTAKRQFGVFFLPNRQKI